MAKEICNHEDPTVVTIEIIFGGRRKYCNSHEAYFWDDPVTTVDPFNNSKYCAFCSGEFEKDEETMKWMGEYPIHIKCQNGYCAN